MTTHKNWMQCDCTAMLHAYWIATAAVISSSSSSSDRMPVTVLRLRCAAEHRQWKRETRTHATGHYIEWRMRQNEAESTLIKVLCASSSQCFSITPNPYTSFSRSLPFISRSLRFSFRLNFRSFVFFFVFFFKCQYKDVRTKWKPLSCNYLVEFLFNIRSNIFPNWFLYGHLVSMRAAAAPRCLPLLLVFVFWCVRVLLFSFSLFYRTFCFLFCCFLCVRFESLQVFLLLLFAIRFVSLLRVCVFLFLKDYLDYLVWDESRWGEMSAAVSVCQVSRTFKCLLTKEEEQTLSDCGSSNFSNETEVK